ncbi:hypothetical protein PG996_002990 [Apiospora saccharicola]|uniref:Uncharacterized protein n=1 Tax=Apiospora saccharicola TaxID=335842 RepID=A0ABR1W2X2_9PEZI
MPAGKNNEKPLQPLLLAAFDATNLALPRMAMLNKSCFVQNFASVHKCPISAGDTFHYPSSALLSSTYNLYSSTASIHAAMLPSQRYDTQRYGRPRQPRQGRPSTGHATTAPAPAPATAPKTVAPSATQLQPPNQQPLCFPDVPNFFDEEGLDSGPFSPPSPTSGDTRELLRKVNELLGKFEAIQSELAHHNEKPSALSQQCARLTTGRTSTQKVEQLFLQQTQRLTGWLSQVKVLFERFVPMADADPLGDTFFDQRGIALPPGIVC